jgi:perosamine synthetase
MKNMSTLGAGGLITFQDPCWLERVQRVRGCEPDADFEVRYSPSIGPYELPPTLLNRHQKNAYTHDCVALRRRGANGMLTEAACVVGRIQLQKLPQFVARRRAIAARLNEGLRDVPGLRLQVEPEGQCHAYHLYTLFVEPNSGIDHERLLAEIHHGGVEVQLRYFPLHLLPEWRLRGGRPGQCPVTERTWFRQQVNLPIYPDLTDEQVEFIIETVRGAASRTRM